MKKVMSIVSILLFCFTVLTGCGKDDPVQKDLINYINNEVSILAELENKVTTEYAATTGKNFVDDATMGVRLKDIIIPATEALLTKAKAISPATEEVKKIHGKYIALVTEQLEAFKLLLEATQKHDEKLVDTVNQKLTHADKTSAEYLADLETLKKEHKVETVKKN